MSYYIGTHFFYHIHIIGDVIIIHSHIHIDPNHNPTDKEHTENDISLIAQISHFENIDVSRNDTVTPLQFRKHKTKFVETAAHWVASIYLENLSLRAPPPVSA